MKLLTELADVRCDHQPRKGIVKIKTSQTLARIDGRLILVKPDPVGCTIVGCPNVAFAIGMKPCTSTVTVKEGYSPFITIDGEPVVLDTLKGLSAGTPPGTTTYSVIDPGQTLVDSD